MTPDEIDTGGAGAITPSAAVPDSTICPVPSRSEKPTGMVTSQALEKTCNTSIPVYPVSEGTGDLLRLGRTLTARASALGPAITATPLSASFSPARGVVPLKNRVNRENDIISHSQDKSYLHPGFQVQPGKTGMETGMELSAEAVPGSLSDRWNDTVVAIARLWEETAERNRAHGEEPPWLDESLDLALQAEVGEAIRAQDRARAVAAINRWRQAWLNLVAEPTASAPAVSEPNWVELESSVLGENIAIALNRPGVAEAKAVRPDLIVYDAEEIGHLDGIKDGNLLRAVHMVKRKLNARVDDPRKADAILGEYESSVQHRNQGVHDMFAEARARFSQWTSNDKSLTHWLRTNAPAVAALWPDAPLDAAWIDWRLKAGAEHMATLDRAFEAVVGISIAPETGAKHE